jgi:hypothetical protein
MELTSFKPQSPCLNQFGCIPKQIEYFFLKKAYTKTGFQNNTFTLGKDFHIGQVGGLSSTFIF